MRHAGPFPLTVATGCDGIVDLVCCTRIVLVPRLSTGVSVVLTTGVPCVPDYMRRLKIQDDTEMVEGGKIEDELSCTFFCAIMFVMLGIDFWN